jgi:hypothetical protein
MAQQHTVPLEVEFLPDGHVRVGETVLGTEDSEKFAAQTLAVSYPIAPHWISGLPKIEPLDADPFP